jgi:hypothetical protein
MLRLAILSCLLCGIARADDTVATYAIVVGSNAGGPGQADLRYAEDDARRVAAVLTDLGGYTGDQVDVVVHPTPDQLREHLAKLAERVQADLTAGRQARVFFYYSGHARAQAIDLGSSELPLDELRTRLFKVPAALTVVVLDACQSGAFSRIKGAAPAADFSYSSRQHLDATGVAVLASSTGSELSQESEQLKSSYFTYHFLVGLRGAGDSNNDGEVSVDEAYRYAYHQTLLATAETAVGGQHVTFEADLKGHGEVPLSYPRAATAQIVLPARIEGKTLIEDRRSHTVVAETYKAKGAPVRIAVAPGDYDVLVRHGTTLSRCQMSAPGEIDLDRCHDEAIVEQRTKGGELLHPLQLSIGLVARGEQFHDDYTRNLENFGYLADGTVSAGFELEALREVFPTLWGGLRLGYMALPRWRHDIIGSAASQALDWNTTTLDAVFAARRGIPGLRRLSLIGELDAGGALSRTHVTGADGMHYADTYVGLSGGVTAGLHTQLGSFGIDATGGVDVSTGITDLIGNSHIAGGLRVGLALTYGR